MTASLYPISHWRHGSTATPRALTPDEKLARCAELKASHKWVALSRALKPLRDASDAFYQAMFGVAEPLPRCTNMRGRDIYDFDRGTQLVAEDVRIPDGSEASNT